MISKTILSALKAPINYAKQKYATLDPKTTEKVHEAAFLVFYCTYTGGIGFALSAHSSAKKGGETPTYKSSISPNIARSRGI